MQFRRTSAKVKSVSKLVIPNYVEGPRVPKTAKSSGGVNGTRTHTHTQHTHTHTHTHTEKTQNTHAHKSKPNEYTWN